METKLTQAEKIALINEAQKVKAQSTSGGAGLAEVNNLSNKSELGFDVDFENPKGELGFIGFNDSQGSPWKANVGGTFLTSPDTISGSGKVKLEKGLLANTFIINCYDDNGNYLGFLSGSTDEDITPADFKGDYKWKSA